MCCLLFNFAVSFCPTISPTTVVDVVLAMNMSICVVCISLIFRAAGTLISCLLLCKPINESTFVTLMPCDWLRLSSLYYLLVQLLISAAVVLPNLLLIARRMRMILL